MSDFHRPTALPGTWSTPAPVVGMFSDANLQAIIERAGARIREEGHQNGIVFLANGDSVNVAAIEHIGGAVSVRAVLDYDYRAKKLDGEFEIVASWK